MYFEARRNAFFIESISEGVKGLEIKEVASLGSKKITEPVSDVLLFEEFFDSFMANFSSRMDEGLRLNGLND
jgi:hypothetical protein